MIEWSESVAAQAGPMPLVFLFGAGASYGADHVSPHPPPLARDLYARLAEQYPRTWGVESQFAHVADQFEADFEAAMGQFVALNPAGAIFSLVDMARYFAGFTPDGTDRYSELLRALDDRTLRRQTAFCSMNYDCVFEKAALHLGFRVHYEGIDNTPIAAGDVRVLKPHGSCNFLTRAGTRPLAPFLLSGSMVEAGIEAHNPDGMRDALTALDAEPMSTRTRFPVMSNFIPDKSTPLSPAQILQVRVGFSERVCQATTIIIVGARPYPHDTHIWEPIRECHGRVFYVGGNYQDLGAANAQHLGPTFAQAWQPLLEVLNTLARTNEGVTCR